MSSPRASYTNIDPNELERSAPLREAFHRDRAFDKHYLPIIDHASMDNNFHPTADLMRAACIIQVVLKHSPDRYLDQLLGELGKGINAIYGATKNAIRYSEQDHYCPSTPYFLENALVWLLSIISTTAQCEKDRFRTEGEDGKRLRSVLAHLPDPPRTARLVLLKAANVVLKARHSGLSMLVEKPREVIESLLDEEEET